MAQYSLGTVSVTNGSPVVQGQGTTWSTQLAANQLFALKSNFTWYYIKSVDSDTQITLTTNYVGATANSQSYVVQRDFTPTQNYPTPTFGDSGTASLTAQSLLQLDAAFSSMSAAQQALQGNMVLNGGLTITINGNTFTGLTLSSATITGSTVNSTPIGATTPSTGAFTTLSTTGAATFANATITSASQQALNIGTGGVNVANMSAQVITSIGAFAKDLVSQSVIGAVANDYYNGGANPTYRGTLVGYWGINATGTIGFLSQSNVGVLTFQNCAAGLIHVNGQSPMYIAFDSNTTTPALTVKYNNLIGVNTATPTHNLDVAGTANITGVTTLTSSTASTSTTTGALVVTGGVGVGGALYAGSAVLNGLRVTSPNDIEYGATGAAEGWNLYYSASSFLRRVNDYGYLWQHNGSTFTLSTGVNGSAGVAPTLNQALSVNGANGQVSFPSGAVAAGDWSRNYLINGGFDVWQNGTTFTFSAAANYTADQWIISLTNGGGVSYTVSKSAPVISGLNGYNVVANNVAAGGYFQIFQKLEAQRLQTLAGQQATFSFDINATTSAGTLTLIVLGYSCTAPDNGSYSNLFAYNVVTLPVGAGRVSYTLTAAQTATLANGGWIGIRLIQNTSAGNINLTLGAFNLEKGPVANPYITRSIALEILDCQRFFACSWPNLSSAAGSSQAPFSTTSPSVSIANAAQLPIGSVEFPVQMRATPTMTLYDVAGTSGKFTLAGVNGNAGALSGAVSASQFSTLTNNSGAAIAAGSAVSFHWSATARL